MKQLVRTEMLKQRTTRTWWAAVLAAPVIGALVTTAVYSVAGTQGNDPLGTVNVVHAVGAPASILTFIALFLGVVGMAGEYRHETITTTFLAVPRRHRLVAAKLLAHAMTGVLLAVLSTVAALAVAVPWLLSADVALRWDGEVAGIAAGLLASTALFGALGVALGALVRNPTVAASAVLLWLLAIEGIIGDVFHGNRVVDWLPAAAGRAMVRLGEAAGELSAPAGAAAFAAYVVVIAAAALALTVRRDVS